MISASVWTDASREGSSPRASLDVVLVRPVGAYVYSYHFASREGETTTTGADERRRARARGQTKQIDFSRCGQTNIRQTPFNEIPPPPPPRRASEHGGLIQARPRSDRPRLCFGLPRVSRDCRARIFFEDGRKKKKHRGVSASAHSSDHDLLLQKKKTLHYMRNIFISLRQLRDTLEDK